MILRAYRPSDCEEAAKLFYETVHAVNARDYTKEQLNAWASENIDLRKWDQSFQDHYSLVAVETRMAEEGKILGFGDMDETGYLDRLYVHKDHQRQGIAAMLCDRLEAYAWKKGAGSVITHASVTAKPFFEKRGYRVVREQQVSRQGILLTNYVMEKDHTDR
ncbi:GNAT family N-acetyltransferase [Lachnospiraceae bacterium KGMB03038]|nr:GNAT family N-acetyltransferase [Lachnospiraceae bacterium KGMB03038]